MSKLHLLDKAKKRKKEAKMTLENIAKLANLSNRTVTRFFSGKDIKLSSAEKITNVLGLDLAGNEILDVKTLKEKRAKEKATYIVSLVQDTSSLEKQGLKSSDINILIQETKKEFLIGKYQKTLWLN